MTTTEGESIAVLGSVAGVMETRSEINAKDESTRLDDFLNETSRSQHGLFLDCHPQS